MKALPDRDAALATPGLRQHPAPFVHQRARSDFYVECELFAHVDRRLERVPTESTLHAAMQGEFNLDPAVDRWRPRARACHG